MKLTKSEKLWHMVLLVDLLRLEQLAELEEYEEWLNEQIKQTNGNDDITH